MSRWRLSMARGWSRGTPAGTTSGVVRRAEIATRIITYAKYPKVVFVVDCRSHMIWLRYLGAGRARTWCSSVRALGQAVRRARIGTLLADADFDAEWVHAAVRSHRHSGRSSRHQRGRPTDKLPSGRWRRQMKQRFGRYKPKYGQRWQVETVNSMLKRRLGSALRARHYKSQCRETILRAITHNVMIVRYGFSTEQVAIGSPRGGKGSRSVCLGVQAVDCRQY